MFARLGVGVGVALATTLATTGATAQASDTFVPECAPERLNALANACDVNSTAFERRACCETLRALDDRECFCNANLGAVEFELRRQILPTVLRAERLCDERLKFGRDCVPLPPFTPLSPSSPPAAVGSPPPPSPPFKPPPPAIVSPSIISSPLRAACTVDGLISLIQSGCSSIGDGLASPLAVRSRDACCAALVKLNAEKCFCSAENAIQDLLREFPANWLAMFSAAPNVCGATILGGWQCTPFVDRAPPPPPPSPPPTPTQFIQRAPLPPFIGRTFGLQDLQAITNDLRARVCSISAYANILDAGCSRLPFLDASTNRAKRCCEQIALMNSALCFCENALASVVEQTKPASIAMFAATPHRCQPSFQTFAGAECSVVVGPLPASPPPPSPPPPPTGSQTFVFSWWPFGVRPPATVPPSEQLWPERPRVPVALLGGR